MLELALAAAVAGMGTGAGELERGRAAYERCAACHLREEATGAQPVGPALRGLAGRRAGSLAGYRYSGPLARSGLVWTAPTLAAFLRDPQAVVPGNRMAFSGLDDEAELQALVAFLLAGAAAAPAASPSSSP